jgi:branched-chain amino acid transport system permease protein
MTTVQVADSRPADGTRACSRAIIILYQILYAFSFLVLISIGLAVIFGMMRVINLAQGEFLMLGAYVCNLRGEAWRAACGFRVLLAAIAVGLFGILVERVLIRFLYGRIIDTLLATWGLSLFIVGGVTPCMGPTTESIAGTLGTIAIGGYGVPAYSLVLILFAVGAAGGSPMASCASPPLRARRARDDAEPGRWRPPSAYRRRSSTC